MTIIVNRLEYAPAAVDAAADTGASFVVGKRGCDAKRAREPPVVDTACGGLDWAFGALMTDARARGPGALAVLREMWLGARDRARLPEMVLSGVLLGAGRSPAQEVDKTNASLGAP